MKTNTYIGSVLVAAVLAAGSRLFAAEAPEAEPKSPREFFNSGTKALAEKKYADAEKWFKEVLLAQNEKVRPAALFNLGHVRFEDGKETLKKEQAGAAAAMERSKVISDVTDKVLQEGNEALAGNNIRRMVNAYKAGNGVLKELRQAHEAVHKAVEVFGGTLLKWQRSADDFRGSGELYSIDTRAMKNAAIVEQHIAKLVDSLREKQEMDKKMVVQRKKMQEMMEKLKQKIPKKDRPPSECETEKECEGNCQGKSMKESKEPKDGKDGKENKTEKMSAETAKQLLNSMVPSNTGRLAMTDKKTNQPKDKKGKTW